MSIPLRIVSVTDDLKDYLFGPRPSNLIGTECRAVMRIDLGEPGYLFFGLTSCFDFVCDHMDELLFSDGINVVVELLPKGSVLGDHVQFHPLVGLQRLPEALEDLDYDEHRIGGGSYWLIEHPDPSLKLIAQLAFPDHRDLLLNLNWPTGECTIEVFYHEKRAVYAVVWRMHA